MAEHHIAGWDRLTSEFATSLDQTRAAIADFQAVVNAIAEVLDRQRKQQDA